MKTNKKKTIIFERNTHANLVDHTIYELRCAYIVKNELFQMMNDEEHCEKN